MDYGAFSLLMFALAGTLDYFNEKRIKMKKLFERQFYYMAKWFRLLYKKRSTWESSAIMAVAITQTVLIVDIRMVVMGVLEIHGKINIIEKISLYVIGLALTYYNFKIYQGKFKELDMRWRDESRIKKNISIFLTGFVGIGAWCFVFLVAWIFDRYKK